MIVDNGHTRVTIGPTAIERSALWAAWADALGFQSELAEDPSWLQKRIGADAISATVPWTRRVGGRQGPTVDLPAGTYSDDTQLRLAVSRCRRASGRFDVETFSKIELSVFLSYELGAGRGTRQAAHALGRRPVRWSSNFFSGRGSSYVKGGGNGAAMRIQPHVWAAPDAHPHNYLRWVLRDTLTTHGHPHGVLGAVFHALSVGSALRDNEVPHPGRWPGMARYLERVPDAMASDEAIAERWLSRWESEVGRTWRSAVEETVDEALEKVEAAARAAEAPNADSELAYEALMRHLGGLDARTRGSGLISALGALYLAWVHRGDPVRGLLQSANLLTSDTDTVATMAGAIVGCVADSDPPGELQDREYVRGEAQRMVQISQGLKVEDFPHPDSLHWEAPRTQSDAVGKVHDGLALAGLGRLEPLGDLQAAKGKEDVGWQWQRLWTGQSLLVKRRVEPHALPDFALPRRRGTSSTVASGPDAKSPRKRRMSRVKPLGAQEQLFAGVTPGKLPDDPQAGVELWVELGRPRDLLLALLEHYAQGKHAVQMSALFGGLFAQHWKDDG